MLISHSLTLETKDVNKKIKAQIFFKILLHNQKSGNLQVCKTVFLLKLADKKYIFKIFLFM